MRKLKQEMTILLSLFKTLNQLNISDVKRYRFDPNQEFITVRGTFYCLDNYLKRNNGGFTYSSAKTDK
jgi:hypothetical protein